MGDWYLHTITQSQIQEGIHYLGHERDPTQIDFLKSVRNMKILLIHIFLDQPTSNVAHCYLGVVDFMKDRITLADTGTYLVMPRPADNIVLKEIEE